MIMMVGGPSKINWDLNEAVFFQLLHVEAFRKTHLNDDLNTEDAPVQSLGVPTRAICVVTADR